MKSRGLPFISSHAGTTLCTGEAEPPPSCSPRISSSDFFWPCFNDVTDATRPLSVDGADEPDLAAVVAVQHQADRIDIPDLKLALIELVGGATAAVAAHDIDIEAGFLEPATLGSHDHADAAALRQPSHVVGDLLLSRCRGGQCPVPRRKRAVPISCDIRFIIPPSAFSSPLLATTELVSVPMPSIEALTTSPALRNMPRAMPTPVGVPVAITSPGSSVTIVER